MQQGTPGHRCGMLRQAGSAGAARLPPARRNTAQPVLCRSANKTRNRSRGTTISQEMAYLLRHASDSGMDASGWIALPDLIARLNCKATEAEILAVIETSEKKRFVLGEALDGRPAVRAAQGHSVALELPVLEAVTSPEQLAGPAVHVTSNDGWAAIQADGYLRRMSRTHIHFATAAAHLRRNSWVAVALQLDLPAALAAGHTLFKAANGVLLTEGPLPVEFVRQVAPEDIQWD